MVCVLFGGRWLSRGTQAANNVLKVELKAKEIVNLHKIMVGGCVLLMNVGACFAIPTLQLDIPSGSYDPTTQTTFSTGSHFDLVALLNGPLDPSRTYYISAAIEPMVAQNDPPPNGSFQLGSTVYSVANLTFGTPPANAAKTLPTHGEFPTYFAEYAFNFDPNSTVPAYDVQDGTTAAGTLFAYNLSVDTSPLLAGYSLHFDLYDIKTNSDGSVEIDEFAPFSHDAQSGTNTSSVPDNGATWLLLAVALGGLVFVPKMRLARIQNRNKR